MASEPDYQGILQTIFTDNWNPANTDGITPIIKKITEQKEVQYNQSQDWIFLHTPRVQQTTAGVGTQTKNKVARVDVDIRVQGIHNHEHYRNVITEVDRILDENQKYISDGVDIINPDDERVDLSNQKHRIYRLMLTVKLETYAQTRNLT